jgi:hypothetical protein
VAYEPSEGWGAARARNSHSVGSACATITAGGYAFPLEQITTAVRGHAVCRGSRHLPNDFGGKVCPLCSGAEVRNRSSLIHRQ